MKKNIEDVNMENVAANNGSQELEEMRRQIALLKNKLDSESIVNDKLMRSVMGTKVGKVNRTMLRLMFILPPAMVLLYVDFAIIFPLSTAFIVVTEAMMLCVGIFMFWNKRLLMSANLANGQLIEESKKLVRFKKREIRYQCVGIPVCAMWLIWLFVELRHCVGDQVFMESLAWGCMAGGIIGGVIGLSVFRSMLRNINEVVRQIEEIS